MIVHTTVRGNDRMQWKRIITVTQPCFTLIFTIHFIVFHCHSLPHEKLSKYMCNVCRVLCGVHLCRIRRVSENEMENLRCDCLSHSRAAINASACPYSWLSSEILSKKGVQKRYVLTDRLWSLTYPLCGNHASSQNQEWFNEDNICSLSITYALLFECFKRKTLGSWMDLIMADLVRLVLINTKALTLSRMLLSEVKQQ